MTNFTFLLDLKHILIFSNNLKKVCIPIHGFSHNRQSGRQIGGQKTKSPAAKIFFDNFFEIFFRIFFRIFLRIFLRNLLDNHTNQIFFLSIIMSRSVVHLTYFLDKKRYGCEEHCF